MAILLLRLGLWSSLVVMVIAVYLGLQQPLHDFFISGAPSQTFCYSQGVTAQVSSNTEATCFTVKDGMFVDVFTPEAAPPVDALEGHAIPGLWDGHGHLSQYGEFLHSVDLFGTASLVDIYDRLATYLSKHQNAGSKHDWIRGVGWDQMALGGKMPTAAMLEHDERLKGLYIMLDRVDVHCVWVSQAVLDLLPENLPDTVPGGEIVRDPGMGVFCDNAMEIVMRLWPRPDEARRTAFLKSAMASLHAVGLVGMHDAGVFPDELRLYDELFHTDDWTLRVYAMIECDERNNFCPDEVPTGLTENSDFLNVKSVKLFADGALGSWGSAMLSPYTDRPETSGSLLVNGSTLTQLARSWSGEGYQVNIHAIGDLANRLAIDAMEASLIDLCPGEMVSTCQSRRRFRIEHSQIIHPHDQARMLSMGILPSVQPTHATSDMKYAEKRLGQERTGSEAYRMRSLVNLGLVLGSDFPVEPPNPFEGIYAAVARRSPHDGKGADGRGKDSWYPEEALSLQQALTGFTEGPAHGAFLDGKAGVIQPGAMADWVVLDRPLHGMDIEDLRTLKVKETWVGGRRVYAR